MELRSLQDLCNTSADRQGPENQLGDGKEAEGENI